MESKYLLLIQQRHHLIDPREFVANSTCVASEIIHQHFDLLVQLNRSQESESAIHDHSFEFHENVIQDQLQHVFQIVLCEAFLFDKLRLKQTLYCSTMSLRRSKKCSMKGSLISYS